MASDALNLLSLNNPVFRAYLYYISILVLKVLAMACLIGRHRFTKGIFRSPEDVVFVSNAKVKLDDEDVERPRRAHLNDLENIPVFFAAAFAYLLTDPAPWLAINLFRAFTWARIAYTLVYAIVPIPQPTRAIVFGVGYFSTIYMCLVTITSVY